MSTSRLSTTSIPGLCALCAQEERRGCKFEFDIYVERALTEIFITTENLDELQERQVLDDHNSTNERRAKLARRRGCEYVE